MNRTVPLVAAGFGIGAALASAPGPVQAVLVAEAVRGGVRRGVRALVGASVTFALLLAALALGLAVSLPRGLALHAVEMLGGGFLLWVAWDALWAGSAPGRELDERRQVAPTVRGALAVALNPGAWLFLGAVAAPLLASAAAGGGIGLSMAVAAALVAGAAAGDSLIVVIGGVGLRRADERVGRWVARLLATVLAGLGLWLLFGGVRAIVTGAA